VPDLEKLLKKNSFLEQEVSITAQQQQQQQQQHGNAAASSENTAEDPNFTTGSFAEAISTSEADLPPRNALEPSLFKCGCDFGGADVSIAPGQGLECDCTSAKCTCSKKCTCTDGRGGSLSFVEEHAEAQQQNAQPRDL